MKRLKLAWGILLGREPAGRRASPATIVRAVVFGKERRLSLQGRRGHHAIGVSADDGPAGMYLVTAANILPESIDDFELFMAACQL